MARLRWVFGAGLLATLLLVNDDGIAETVDCGAGAADDAQLTANDTYLGCELI